MISKLAVVETENLGDNVTINEFSIIRNNVKIGNNVIIHPFVTIEENSIIGDNVEIFPNAVIGRQPKSVSTILSKISIGKAKTTIKNNCIIGCSVIIYQGTIINSDTLIGDNTTIRENTILEGFNIIGPNSFIQKNCKIGIKTRIIQMSSLASSTVIGSNNFISSAFCCVSDNTFGIGGYSEEKVGPKIGNDNLIGPNVTVLNNLNIGNNNIIGAKSLVTKNITDNGVYYGSPSKFIRVRKK